MAESVVKVKVGKDRVARVRIERSPLNILDLETIRALNRALESLVPGNNYKLLVLEAAGKVFSAGVDVADHAPDRIEEALRRFHHTIRLVGMIDEPTLAVVHGDALGGGAELAMACDLVVAHEKARIGFPEINLGVYPPVAAALLSRLVPRRIADELVYTGRLLSAAEAARLGLVNQVLPEKEFEKQRKAFEARLVRSSGTSLRLAKKAIVEAARQESLTEAIDRAESIYLATLMRTADAREGIAAFLEKRAPRWVS